VTEVDSKPLDERLIAADPGFWVRSLIGPLLEGTRPRTAAVAAALVVTAGAGLVQGLGRTDAIGVAWAVAVFGCEAAFTLLAIPVLGRHGPWGVSVHATWLATVMFGVLGAISEGPQAVTKLDRADWLAVGYLAVAVTAAAFVLWYSSVRRLGASRAGLLTGIAPVAAAVSGVRPHGAGTGKRSLATRSAVRSASTPASIRSARRCMFCAALALVALARILSAWACSAAAFFSALARSRRRRFSSVARASRLKNAMTPTTSGPLRKGIAKAPRSPLASGCLLHDVLRSSEKSATHSGRWRFQTWPGRSSSGRS